MSQKKCPKCGELNPVEAVMCWACYTPLTPGAVAGGGTAAMAATTPAATAEQKEKKAVAPWQIGVVAVAVVLALGFGVSQIMGSSTGGDDVDNVAGPIPKGPRTGGGSDRPPSVIGELPVPLPPSVGGPPMKVSEVVEFDVVSPPNPELQWGVVGLAVKDPNVSPQRAAGMATFAHQQFGGKSKWKAMQIFVFRNREAATQFNRFQIGRKYDVVADDDNSSSSLAALWPDCIVRYEANGNAAPDVRFPSQRPGSWWTGAPAR